MFGPSKIYLLALALSTAQAAPTFHTKRIAQVIVESTQKWEAACLAAGGAAKCNPVSVTAFSTLLAAAGPCEQQDAADQMIDLAKQLNNDPQMITLAQIFCQQPRNSPNSVSIPYCQKAPKNSELSGLFQCQFAGSNPNTFVGGVQVGGPGTIPFGFSSPLSPPGSCPANPNGPVPDGQQLVGITQNPGTGKNLAPNPVSPGGNGGSGGASTPAVNKPVSSGSSNTGTPAVNTPAPAPTPTSAIPQNGVDKLQNGKDAQKLNAKFSTLTANSSCDAKQDAGGACIDGAFSQCVNGKFVASSKCSATLICAALPLVNKPGTSVTCTTEADALARIANTGAQGGLTGSG